MFLADHTRFQDYVSWKTGGRPPIKTLGRNRTVQSDYSIQMTEGSRYTGVRVIISRHVNSLEGSD
jgi:hypothetical protein